MSYFDSGRESSSFRATAIGSIATLLWSLLALFTTLTGDIPPFQLLGMTFSIAFLVSCIFWTKRGGRTMEAMRQPAGIWFLGVGALAGYHLLFFVAVKSAPPIEASLIAYLWPLLIVLFSALLPRQKMRWYHLAGAFMGLGGIALLVTGGSDFEFQTSYLPGYLAAGFCALIWSGYTVINRLLIKVPTDIIGGFCAVTAVIGSFLHLVLEQTVVPNGTEWLAIFGLGLGPVSVAFFFWDHGVKQGNLPLLGIFSYATPLISTVLLIAAGQGSFSWSVLIAAGLIVGGALLAARARLARIRKAEARSAEAGNSEA